MYMRLLTDYHIEQQVSTYPYVDVNNLWTIHPSNKLYNASQPLKYVKNHDRIRLEHFASSRKLHSHDHRSAVSTRKEYLEVS
jgi:dolichyl-phosphate-mannose--protein O-mannosyl transferase